LGPDEGKPEASAIGVTNLLFDGHAAIIERDQTAQGVVAVGGQPPGFPAASGPNADDPDSDDGILAQFHPAEVDGLTRLKATFSEQPSSRFIFQHRLVGRTDKEGVTGQFPKTLDEAGFSETSVSQERGRKPGF
jgi:hypothetical protein